MQLSNICLLVLGVVLLTLVSAMYIYWIDTRAAITSMGAATNLSKRLEFEADFCVGLLGGTIFLLLIFLYQTGVFATQSDADQGVASSNSILVHTVPSTSRAPGALPQQNLIYNPFANSMYNVNEFQASQ